METQVTKLRSIMESYILCPIGPTAKDTTLDLIHHFKIPLDLTSVPIIENFLGRQDELTHLWQYLKPTTKSESQKVAIIHGLGGIGKTQLAARFARDHKKDFTAIFWLSSTDRSTLLQSLASLFSQLPGSSQSVNATSDKEVEKRAGLMLQWLALEGNKRWLIIFDNIDQYSPLHGTTSDGHDIAKFFPRADHGSILITSRLQTLSELGKPFPDHRLDSHSSIQLLLQSSRLLARNTSNSDLPTLANRLGGLPLATVIAGAFMRETGTSVTEYLQYYEESWSELQLKSKPERQYPQGNILQTWMISFLEIQKQEPSAAGLLLLLARFDNRDIWYELVKSARHSSNIPDWLEHAILSGFTFKIGVKSLIRFSLLECKQQEGSYTMHPVVQDWCLHIADTNETVTQIQLNELALISIGYSVPNVNDKDCSVLQQRLLPHAKYACHLDWSDDNIEVLGAFHGLGNLYSDQGMLNETEEIYQRALAGYVKALGPDHISTLSTVNNLGLLYSSQGKLKETEEMFQRALAGREKLLGPDHTSTLSTVNNLSNLYRDQGKLKEAEEMYQRALAGREKALGLDHISTLDSVHCIGILYRDQGKLKGAEEMFQRARAGREKTLGPDHITTLDSVHCVGVLYRDQGKLKEAEEIFQRARAGYKKALGPDHTSTLSTAKNLAILYSGQGNSKEPEKIYQQVRQAVRRLWVKIKSRPGDL